MNQLEYIVPEPSAFIETLAPIFLGIIFAIFLSYSKGKAKITSFIGLWFTFNALWAFSATFPAVAAAILPTSILLHNTTIVILGSFGVALSMWLWTRHLGNITRLHLQHSFAFAVYIIGIYLFSWRKNMMWALQPDDAPKLSPEELILFASRWGLISIILGAIFLRVLNCIIRFILFIIMWSLPNDPNVQSRQDLIPEDVFIFGIAASVSFVVELAAIVLPIIRSPRQSICSLGQPILSFITWIRRLSPWLTDQRPDWKSMSMREYNRAYQIYFFRCKVAFKVRRALYSVRIIAYIFNLMPRRLVPGDPEKEQQPF